LHHPIDSLEPAMATSSGIQLLLSRLPHSPLAIMVAFPTDDFWMVDGEWERYAHSP
jgi:hypothetical protein